MAQHRKKTTFIVWLRMYVRWLMPVRGQVYSYEAAMRHQAHLEAKTILVKLLVSLKAAERTTGSCPLGGAVTYSAWSNLSLIEEQLRHMLRRDPYWRSLNIRYDPSLSSLSLFRFLPSQSTW